MKVMLCVPPGGCYAERWSQGNDAVARRALFGCCVGTAQH